MSLILAKDRPGSQRGGAVCTVISPRCMYIVFLYAHVSWHRESPPRRPRSLSLLINLLLGVDSVTFIRSQTPGPPLLLGHFPFFLFQRGVFILPALPRPVSALRRGIMRTAVTLIYCGNLSKFKGSTSGQVRRLQKSNQLDNRSVHREPRVMGQKTGKVSL